MKSRWWLGGLTVDPHMLRTLLQTEFFIVVFLMHAAVTISRRERVPEREREKDRAGEREPGSPKSTYSRTDPTFQEEYLHYLTDCFLPHIQLQE